MSKFIIKYLIIIVSMIILLFFSLIGFQKHAEEQEMAQMGPGMPEFGYDMPMPPMPDSSGREAPPLHIPLLFIIGVSSVIVYLILRYIEKNFVSPLLQIENNVSEIKEGRLNVKFTPKSENKTVIDTFKTMNEMVQGLKQREKLHNEFIQNLVHDLRAPVIAQERAMEILTEEFSDNPLFDGLVQNNEAYLTLINKIIESLSRKEIKIDKIDFDFEKLADSVIEVLKPAAEAKNIELRKLIQNNLTVWADYISLNRIVMNLVSNAIENIDNNKTVTIKAEKRKNKTIITIEDNGQGMNDETKAKLFQRNVKESKSEKKSLSGMGLSIVYELVEKNGGTIQIESKENQYTKFIIELDNGE